MPTILLNSLTVETNPEDSNGNSNEDENDAKDEDIVPRSRMPRTAGLSPSLSQRSLTPLTLMEKKGKTILSRYVLSFKTFPAFHYIFTIMT